MQGIGQALGPLLGGLLISWQGFSIPFTVSGLIGCLGLSVLLTTFREKGSHTTNPAGIRLFQGIREVIRSRPILLTSSTVAAQMFAVGAYNAFLPVYAKSVMGLDAWHIGLVFGLQTTTTLLARPFMGKFSDRVGRRGIITGAVIWLGFLIMLLPLLGSFELLLGFGCAWGLGISVISSVAGAYITDLSRRAHYGAAHGIFGTIYDIGEASGPVVAGVLVAGLGFATIYLVDDLLLEGPRLDQLLVQAAALAQLASDPDVILRLEVRLHELLNQAVPAHDCDDGMACRR